MNYFTFDVSISGVSPLSPLTPGIPSLPGGPTGPLILNIRIALKVDWKFIQSISIRHQPNIYIL